MSNQRRNPQQERGEKRLSQLLEAAASVMADVGYEAATMTQIAELAQASIGTLYQYFPNKEALMNALRQQYIDEMKMRWAPFTATPSKLSIKQLVDRIFDIVLDYIEKRPAYFPLLGTPRGNQRDPSGRSWLREHFAALFREKLPEMTLEESFRVANVTVQVLKGMHPLYLETSPEEKQEIVAEFKLLLMSYLKARLKA
ncbi:TetR/AcrR family transcriptional regulator [Terriglobus saanensis]|uniref:Regulatory protein TetR n=1 Tax=Terriglobus saanensis (strain ATCC BAA-1853 / DSM 23119 / SP1PR4) TaxID=401053 RepID=E8V2D6_TERSS|nr:TetR/AcrR family transcriptional regulator [Terriglobus saanensis]ADV81269.1 regulatory protein TetR [Terriglobus saanensis SP1PR4]